MIKHAGISNRGLGCRLQIIVKAITTTGLEFTTDLTLNMSKIDD